MSKRNKAFTIIELIAVLVILSIIVLIAVPLILTIKNKFKLNAYKRSIDAYGKAVELAIANNLIDKGTIPTDFSTLKIEYTGYEVNCNIMQIKENGGVYLSECTVNGKEIKDKKTEDGWYHYNQRDLTNEEYVDMYGNALKEASVAYYTENNSIVSDYKTLKINYKGKSVSCDVTINYDGTIYLKNCTVAGTSVQNKTYGTYSPYTPYLIGDEVTYNDVKYYVIANSGVKESTVTLLKAEPLTVEEVNTYGGVGTDNNHVNMHVAMTTNASYYQTAYDINGYGGMAYYSGTTCSWSNSNGCTTDYEQSEVKYVVDTWMVVQAPTASEARLITYDELVNDLGCTSNNCSNSLYNWIYNSKYSYHTMSAYNSTNWYWNVGGGGRISGAGVQQGYRGTVRPVIVLSKSLISS